jgi:arylsulfatase A-like enzyme
MNANDKVEAAGVSPAADSQGKPSGPGGTPALGHGVPWEVAGRIGLLFTALCLIKLAMMVHFRKHLYYIHWLIWPASGNWLNQVAFWGFVALVGLNLWRLGKTCAAIGPQTVRRANTVVLVLGCLFIFLTFHAGRSNYLDTLLTGVLQWQNLGAYLSQACFFQTPFLAGWLMVYVLIYYVLARQGREQWVLQVTAVFAVLYLAFCLQSLAAYQGALVVADCLGIIGLLGASLSRRPLGWICLIQPLIWCGFLFCLFRNQEKSLSNLNPEFAILTGGSLVLFIGTGALAWRGKFYAAWSWLLPFASTSFVLLICANYTQSENFQNFLLMGLTLPHYFLGEFFLACGLLCLATLYRHWLPKGSLLWLDVFSLALITLAVIDLRLAQIMGIRLDWQAVEFADNLKMAWLEARPYLPETLVALLSVVVLYALMVGVWQRGPSAKSLSWGPGGWFLVAAFLSAGAAGKFILQRDLTEGESVVLLAKTCPLFNSVTHPILERKTLLDITRQLGMEQMFQQPAGSPTHSLRRLNVVFIFQESSYNKYLSLFDGKVATQPLLAAYKDRMEVFPNFFSNFAASINARFAALTGLYPVRDYKKFTQDRVKVKSIFEILSEAGYQTSVFDSSYLDYSDFREFLGGRGIRAMYDADDMPGKHNLPSVLWGLRESETTDAIRAQLQEYATNHQSFFLTYVPVAPHNPFDGVPQRFQKHKLTQLNDYTPQYLNDLLYMDECISSVLDQLRDSGLLKNTLVVITDDHGEMLGENGGPIGHGWSTRPDLTNIPLIIMDPDNPGYHVNYTFGSQVDLLPTMVDLLGLPLPEDQLYEGTSLYSPSAQTGRAIYLNSFQQFAIVKAGHYLMNSRETLGKAGAPDTSAFKIYGITNSFAKTVFPELPTADAPAPSIDQFDAFQENFLKNYPLYCRMMRH